MTTQIRQDIVQVIAELLEEDGLEVPLLTDETVLLETGLDSLGFAVLVTRLEEKLGFDPFSLMADAVYPRTLGEFASIYERMG